MIERQRSSGLPHPTLPFGLILKPELLIHNKEGGDEKSWYCARFFISSSYKF